MSIKACQMVKLIADAESGVLVDAPSYSYRTKKVCREAASEDFVRKSLRDVIGGNCRSEGYITEGNMTKMVNRCTPMSEVWIEVAKPSRIQKIGLIISDFLDGVFN